MNINTFANKEELHKIEPLFIETFSETPYNETWTAEQVHERVSEAYERGKDYCIYAEKEGKIIGFIICDVETWNDGKHIYIEDTAVHKNYRNKGIGAQMVKHLEKLAKGKISTIDFNVNSQGKAATFWAKQGYKLNGYIEMNKKL